MVSSRIMSHLCDWHIIVFYIPGCSDHVLSSLLEEYCFSMGQRKSPSCYLVDFYYISTLKWYRGFWSGDTYLVWFNSVITKFIWPWSYVFHSIITNIFKHVYRSYFPPFHEVIFELSLFETFKVIPKVIYKGVELPTYPFILNPQSHMLTLYAI